MKISTDITLVVTVQFEDNGTDDIADQAVEALQELMPTELSEQMEIVKVHTK